MSSKVQQILEAAKLLRQGDVNAGMKQILGATENQVAVHPSASAMTAAALSPQANNPLATLMPGAPAPMPHQLTAFGLPAGIPTAPGLPPSPAPMAAFGLPGMPMAAPPAFPAYGAPQNDILASLGLGAPSQEVAAAAANIGASGPAPSGDAQAAALASLMQTNTPQADPQQSTAQQAYYDAYNMQVQEMQNLHEKQQEAAQLALIMEAAEAQAEMAKSTLDEEQEAHHPRRVVRKPQVICGNWQRGYCKHAENCQYSHPDKEKGSAAVKRGPADLMRYNFKKAICRPFSSGNCAHGARCMFAHGNQEIRAPGAAVSQDEEEMIQRVAAGGKKTSGYMSANTTASSSTQPAPSVVAPIRQDAAGHVAQLTALQNLAQAAQPPPPPGNPRAATLEQQQIQAVMALAGQAAGSPFGAAVPGAMPAMGADFLSQLTAMGGLTMPSPLGGVGPPPPLMPGMTLPGPGMPRPPGLTMPGAPQATQPDVLAAALAQLQAQASIMPDAKRPRLG